VKKPPKRRIGLPRRLVRPSRKQKFPPRKTSKAFKEVEGSSEEVVGASKEEGMGSTPSSSSTERKVIVGIRREKREFSRRGGFQYLKFVFIENCLWKITRAQVQVQVHVHMQSKVKLTPKALLSVFGSNTFNA
jgi:hypothetical protein